MIEKIYYDEENYVAFNIPESGNIGAFMSGGTDSTLMCYILAKTIKEKGLDTHIVPVTAEVLKRPFNLRFTSNIVSRIGELTGFTFDHHPCFIIPNHTRKVSDQEKIDIMSRYTRNFAEKYQLETMFNGLTANPPLEMVDDNDFGERQKCRDDQKWREEQKTKKGLSVPFIDVDKKVIAKLYEQLNLTESLLPLTRSCEAEMIETDYFTKDCFEVRNPGEECWWCREKAYGFENQL